MHDMLVRLYALPDARHHRDRMAQAGLMLRHAMTFERGIVTDWIRTHFSRGWADEVQACFARQPVSCILALRPSARPGAPADRFEILGFAAYEATARGFFGPMGTLESARGRGVGAAVCLEALHAMGAMGYGYAAIGGVGPAEFYSRVCGATPIADSSPGVYANMLDPGPPKE